MICMEMCRICEKHLLIWLWNVVVEVLKIISVDVNVSSKFVMNFGLIFYIKGVIFGEKVVA